MISPGRDLQRNETIYLTQKKEKGKNKLQFGYKLKHPTSIPVSFWSEVGENLKLTGNQESSKIKQIMRALVPIIDVDIESVCKKHS